MQNDEKSGKKVILNLIQDLRALMKKTPGEGENDP